MRLLPEGAGLVLLLASGKGILVEVELEQLAQVGFAGVVAAALPVADSLLRHLNMQRHRFLGQTRALAQAQQALGEGKVPRFVAVMIAHGSPLITRAAQAKKHKERVKKTEGAEVKSGNEEK